MAARAAVTAAAKTPSGKTLRRGQAARGHRAPPLPALAPRRRPTGRGEGRARLRPRLPGPAPHRPWPCSPRLSRQRAPKAPDDPSLPPSPQSPYSPPRRSLRVRETPPPPRRRGPRISRQCEGTWRPFYRWGDRGPKRRVRFKKREMPRAVGGLEGEVEVIELC